MDIRQDAKWSAFAQMTDQIAQRVTFTKKKLTHGMVRISNSTDIYTDSSRIWLSVLPFSFFPVNHYKGILDENSKFRIDSFPGGLLMDACAAPALDELTEC